MYWKEGKINGVIVRALDKFSDARGWLLETYRSDETSKEIQPAMCYMSMTMPGKSRGPHEHTYQTDMFCFTGPGSFIVKLWDRRLDSSTYGNMISIEVGEDSPMIVIVPPGVVHGYKNITDQEAYVLNLPNKLYAGENKTEPVDEIRHEDDNDGVFVL